MNEQLNCISQMGILPVIVIEDAAAAIPTAKALQAGGIPAAEITLRTGAGLEAIRAIAEEVPEVLVGAGTVTTALQAADAVAAGAKFIVCPGLCPEVVEWCVVHEIPVIPGVSTASEALQAQALGAKVLKFFPAEASGGPAWLKAMAGPFADLKFIPTGGISAQNLSSYAGLPNVLACGLSAIAPKAQIAAGDFAGITANCRGAVDALLGLRFAHLGINNADEAAAAGVVAMFSAFLNLPPADNPKSTFCGPNIEVIKYTFRGEKGHIAFFCSDIERAVYHLQHRGVAVNPDSYEYDDRGKRVVYLAEEFGGFAIHLVRA